MHFKQHYLRYLYAGAFVIILSGAGVGGLVWMRMAPAPKSAVHQLMVPTPVAGVTPTSVPRAGHATPTPSKHTTPKPLVSIQTDAAVHLLIPKIGVDAPIEMVGLDPTGRLQVPTKNQWSDVGWYRNGTTPGEQGSAVMDGHLDTNTGAPAIFWKLNALQVGDMVMVRDKTGRMEQFRVFKVQSYDINQAPLDQIFSKKDGEYLNLITCAGSWDYSQNQFQQRLVVFTKLV